MQDIAPLLQPDRGQAATPLHLVDKRSFEDWLEVSPAKSPRSHSATDRPRRAASRAIAAPVAPPPTTSTSKASCARRARAAERQAGLEPILLGR